MAILKTTRIGGIRESATLQFRAEFFNTFNHPQFNNPSAGCGLTANSVEVSSASSFGIISESVNPRLIQFALKYSF